MDLWSCQAFRKLTGRPLVLTGASFPADNVLSSQKPVVAKQRPARNSTWRRSLSHKPLSCQISPLSSEESALPRQARCELSRLCCHGHNLLLSSYLCRIKRKKNSSCSACGHQIQNLAHLFWIVPISSADFGVWPDC